MKSITIVVSSELYEGVCNVARWKRRTVDQHIIAVLQQDIQKEAGGIALVERLEAGRAIRVHAFSLRQQGQTYKAIGEQLGCSATTAKGWANSGERFADKDATP